MMVREAFLGGCGEEGIWDKSDVGVAQQTQLEHRGMLYSCQQVLKPKGSTKYEYSANFQTGSHGSHKLCCVLSVHFSLQQK
jgi:hypothetical protein